jgi:Ni/Co efflux regulator RcnB
MSEASFSRSPALLAGCLMCLSCCAAPLAGPAQEQSQAERQAAPRHYDHPEYHFRTEDRDRLLSHYQDSQQWRDRRDRHEYYEGQRLEGDWETRVRPMPAEYTRELPPPPSGYVFGYSDGYAVAYNPTTHIVADAADLAATAEAQ